MKPINRTVLYAIAAVAVVALISSALTIVIMRRASDDTVILSTEEYGRFSELMALEDVMEKVESEYYSKAPTREDMIAGAANGVLDTLDDPYARYYTADEYSKYLSTINGEYYGIGMLIGQADDVGAKVLDVYKGGPAEGAGIKIGDILTHVDGTSIANMELEDVSALVDAQKAEGVNLSLLRGSETLELTVTGQNITEQRVHSYLYNERTGYITISMFTGNCADEFENALKDLKSRNVKSLVIDLRNNPGGSLEAVVEIADMLLGRGMTIVTVGSAGSKDETVFTAKGSPVGIPLAILMNENSASASEVLAAAVQENDVGIIVGVNSYGKGVVQTTMYIDATGGSLKLTTDAYYTPAGNDINGIGITPDIYIELPAEYQNVAISSIEQSQDAQLWEALNYVREKANEVS